MINQDSLGDRMKGYENVTRTLLGRKTYSILRVDGKAFHTYTRHLAKPFDKGLINSFHLSTKALMQEMQGVVLAYHQSDEVSIFFTDTLNENSDLWFGGNVQKISSVSASIFTCAFNRDRLYYPNAFFDSRVFQVPSLDEVNNYFRWRNADCYRNAISGIASTIYHDRELHGKSTEERAQMISEAGYYWLEEEARNLFGSVFFKDEGGIIQTQGWNFMHDGGSLMNLMQKCIDNSKRL